MRAGIGWRDRSGVWRRAGEGLTVVFRALHRFAHDIRAIKHCLSMAHHFLWSVLVGFSIDMVGSVHWFSGFCFVFYLHSDCTPPEIIMNIATLL